MSFKAVMPVVLLICSLVIQAGCTDPPFDDDYDSYDVEETVRYTYPFVFSNDNGTLDLYWCEGLERDYGEDFRFNESLGGIRHMIIDGFGNALTNDVKLYRPYGSTGSPDDLFVHSMEDGRKLVFFNQEDYYDYGCPANYILYNGSHETVESGLFNDIRWKGNEHPAGIINDTVVPAWSKVLVSPTGNVTFFDISSTYGQRRLSYESFSRDGNSTGEGFLESYLWGATELALTQDGNGNAFLLYQDRNASLVGGKLYENASNERKYERKVLFLREDAGENPWEYRSSFELKYHDDMIHMMERDPDGWLWYRQYDSSWNLELQKNTTINTKYDFNFAVDDDRVYIVFDSFDTEIHRFAFTALDHSGNVKVPIRSMMTKHYSYTVQADKPVIYLYPEEETTDTVTVTLPGRATFIIPEIPLGRTITWDNVGASPDGTLSYEGEEYPYLFYEGEFRPLYSDMGWRIERKDGQLFLDGETVTYDELGEYFRSELAEAGLFRNEIDDFVGYWFGPEENFFFDHHDFSFAVMYIPQETVDTVCPISTLYPYESVVRVFFSVVPYTEGVVLREPVYDTASGDAAGVGAGASALHEWGVVEGFPWEPDLTK